MKYNKITEEDIQEVLKDIMTNTESYAASIWCEPLGDGLYRTGDCIHGEGFKDDLIKAFKSYNESKRTD